MRQHNISRKNHIYNSWKDIFDKVFNLLNNSNIFFFIYRIDDLYK